MAEKRPQIGTEGALNTRLDHSRAPEQECDMACKREQTNKQSHGDPFDRM